MAADPRKALAPLDPKDTAKFGPPETWTHPRSGDRDIAIYGWTIGKGEVNAAGTDEMSMRRGTTVTISLTATGRLITTKLAWTRGTDGIDTESATGQFHETPDAAYRWLLNDGKGKLGPASKTAWVQACRTFAPMADFEFEHIE